MDVFTSRTPHSHNSGTPAVQFINTHMDETTDELHITAKAEEISSVEVGNFLKLPSPSLSPKYKNGCRKHHRKHQMASKPKIKNHTCMCKSKSWSSNVRLDRSKRIASSSFGFLNPNHSENARLEGHPQPVVQATAHALQVLQHAKRDHSPAILYRTYCLSDGFTRCKIKRVSSYISRRLKKVISEMKEHFFDLSVPISINVFLVLC